MNSIGRLPYVKKFNRNSPQTRKLRFYDAITIADIDNYNTTIEISK